MVLAHAPVDAVSRRVSGLDLPGIGLRHHLVSMIPGAVVRLRFADGIQVGVPRMAPGTDAMIGPDAVIVRAGNPGLAGKLPSHGQPESEDQVPTLDVAGSAPVTSGWWGTRKYYEQCVLPTDLRDTGHADRDRPMAPVPGVRRVREIPLPLLLRPGGPRMNPRQRRGVMMIVIAIVGAVAVFFAVLSYVNNIESEVGDKVQAWRVTTGRAAVPTDPAGRGRGGRRTGALAARHCRALARRPGGHGRRGGHAERHPAPVQHRHRRTRGRARHPRGDDPRRRGVRRRREAHARRPGRRVGDLRRRDDHGRPADQGRRAGDAGARRRRPDRAHPPDLGRGRRALPGGAGDVRRHHRRDQGADLRGVVRARGPARPAQPDRRLAGGANKRSYEETFQIPGDEK